MFWCINDVSTRHQLAPILAAPILCDFTVSMNTRAHLCPGKRVIPVKLAPLVTSLPVLMTCAISVSCTAIAPDVMITCRGDVLVKFSVNKNVCMTNRVIVCALYHCVSLISLFHTCAPIRLPGRLHVYDHCRRGSSKPSLLRSTQMAEVTEACIIRLCVCMHKVLLVASVTC